MLRNTRSVASLVCTLLITPSLVAQAGSLDPTFGNGGIVTTPNTTTGCDVNIGCGLAIQTDGKILVSGAVTASNNTSEVAVARYNSNGALDSSFGSGGIATAPSSGPAFGLAVQIDGKILVGSTTELNLAVVRFNANGTLDSSFGTGGIAQISAAGRLFSPVVGGLGLLSDGKIVVGVGATLVRLLTDGSLDSSFGSGGVAPLLTVAQGLGLLSSGKALVLNGLTFTTGSVARFSANGSLDSSFGIAGQVPSVGQPLAVVPLSNGKILIAGTLDNAVASSTTGTPSQGFVVTRYNSAGVIDGTFGTHGAAVTAFPGDIYSVAMSLAVQSNGDIVAAGLTAANNPAFGGEPSDFALARYTSAGQLDTTFGANGLVTTAFGTNGGNAAAVTAIAIQSDGKIVVAGFDNSLQFRAPNNGFTLARYLSQ